MKFLNFCYDTAGEVINVYSQMNPDFLDIIYIVNKNDVSKAKQCINEAIALWYDTDNNPELHDVCIGDWINDTLRDNNIQFEVYYKDFENSDDL